jgi:hypothetical protein
VALLGKIIKGAVHLGYNLVSEVNDPVAAQQELLKELLTKAAGTAFGEHYRFNDILASDHITQAFASRVPIHEYHDIYNQWWHRQRASETDITWPGNTEYFALSSGTTGGPSKHIPVSEEMIKAIRTTGIRQILSLANFDLPADIYEKEILMLGSTTQLVDKGDYLEGEISGISASRIPGWFESYYKPGKEIAGINDFDTRVQEIIHQAPNWDIGALSGIPSWIQLMLERVVEHHKLQTIHDIWPNLSIYATGGIAYEPYRKGFEKLLARPIIFVDTYLASEGFFAFQSRPDTRAMGLVLNNGIYFEFVPFNEQNFDEEGKLVENPTVLNIAGVEEDQEYALLVSTCSGAWRYMIGDTVRFTDKARSEILITGRIKHFLSVTGEQLSVENMNEAIAQVEAGLGITIREFTVSAIPYGQYFAHRWYIGTDDPVDHAAVKEKLDTTLKSLNKNYRRARERGLKEVYTELLSPSVFHSWQESNNKLGGQTKTPRVMTKEQLASWEEFISGSKAL